MANTIKVFIIEPEKEPVIKEYPDQDFCKTIAKEFFEGEMMGFTSLGYTGVWHYDYFWEELDFNRFLHYGNTLHPMYGTMIVFPQEPNGDRREMTPEEEQHLLKEYSLDQRNADYMRYIQEQGLTR